MSKIKINFAGGAQEVTGSNFLIEKEIDGKTIRILIDSGLPQGEANHGDTFSPYTYNPKDIDYLLVTHAHLDHIGKIGFLINQGFSGEIFSTRATKEISRPALEDAYHLLEREYEEKQEKAPYTIHNVETAFSMWHTVEYRESVKLKYGVTAIFTNAAHVLGSAMIQVSFPSENGVEKVLFTGDMGNNSLLLPEADIPNDSDYVFMECVYGNREHEGLEKRSENFKKVILENIEKKGTLVIPAFAIERTQEILSEINDLIESRKMPVVPVYLDSPLSIEITGIFKHYKHLLNDESKAKIEKGDDLFSFPGLHFAHTRDESMEINEIPGPKIVIAGSGMVQGGRVMHHVRKYVEYKQNTILIVGYQAKGTGGNRLLQVKDMREHGQEGKHINILGSSLEVNAQIVNLAGYSAHRDVHALLDFVKVVSKNAKKINLILGDVESLEGFKETLKEKLNIEAYIPKKDEVLEL